MAVSKSLRFQVLRRDNHACRYCGRSAPEVRITVDHVVPEALGGPDTPENLVAACSDCNSGKSATPPDAALVVQVQDDALRWSAAVRSVAQDMVADVERRNQARGQFEQAWNRWTFGSSTALLPGNWRDTVDTFVSVGLPMAVLLECVDIAMGRGRVDRDSKFRYMCGIAWSRVSELQQAALRRVGRPAPSAAMRQGNGDEVVSSLFGLLPWCDQPDVWPAFIAEFDQAHEDDEGRTGEPLTYDHWSDFEKVFAFIVGHVVEQREALLFRVRQALNRLTPEAKARYWAESAESHEKAGPPDGTTEEIAGHAVALAMVDHPDAEAT